MKAILQPIMAGVLVYIVLAASAWFVVAWLPMPHEGTALWIVPIFFAPVPLFAAGYIGARIARSRKRLLRVLFGVIAGLTGFLLPWWQLSWVGEWWGYVVFLIGAASVAALGGLLGARRASAL